MGLSKSYLKLGPTLAWTQTLSTLVKTAAMAKRIIEKRQNPMITPVEFPDEVLYSVNEKVMKQFRFSIDQKS